MHLHIDLPPDMGSVLSALAAAHQREPEEEAASILQNMLRAQRGVMQENNDPALTTILAIRSQVQARRKGELQPDSTRYIRESRDD